jgi:hypothetical protein
LYFSKVTNQQAPLDGSAWMAQRQKKLEEQGERERMDMERRKKEEEEEKRSRRKSQFDALKVSVICDSYILLQT